MSDNTPNQTLYKHKIHLLENTNHLTNRVFFAIVAGMSIKLTLTMGAVKTEASLKDAAYGELMQLVLKHQDGVGASSDSIPPSGSLSGSIKKDGEPTIEPAKAWIQKHTASEVLSRIGWETNPEKILLLAAFHETHGGTEGWRSADINERFNQAKEPFPANFPRDIRAAIDGGLIGTVSSRTYRVGRTGWLKIEDAIKMLP